MPRYRLNKDYDPIKANTPLWQVKRERPAEYEGLITELEASHEDFETLKEKCKVMLQGFEPFDTSVRFVEACSRRDLTYGDLDKIATGDLAELVSPFARLVRVLAKPYEPLRIVKNLPESLEVEFGSSCELSIETSGNPSGLNFWFFLSRDAKSYEPLEVDELHDCITLGDIVPADLGHYTVTAKPCLNIYDEKGKELPGVTSASFELKAKRGSIWISKDYEPRSTRTIRLESSEEFLEIEAVSLEELTYQWYKGKEPIVGADRPRYDFADVNTDTAAIYFCVVSNSHRRVQSSYVRVKVDVLSAAELALNEKYPCKSEKILVLLEPELKMKGEEKKLAIGARVELRFVAACKWPLSFEWVRRGERRDVVCQSTKGKRIEVGGWELLAESMVLEDTLPDVYPPVSTWVYQCQARCPRTGQAVSSRPVRVPVSYHLSKELAFPEFKVALVICQEEYESEFFPELNAPRTDGKALVEKLREMKFQVISFVNLTLSEVRRAVDLFCELIDEYTFALFYYNGHALCSGEETYLVAKDTHLDPRKPIPAQVVWQYEIESVLVQAAPLLAVVIYDSCRDSPPSEVADLFKRHEKEEKEVVNINMVVAYGTRALMRSYEYSSLNGSQGLYMKHLLKFLGDPGLPVTAFFDKVASSFSRSEHPSVTERMKPEYRSMCSQEFFLACPLRSPHKPPALRRLFFNLFSFLPQLPRTKDMGANNQFSLVLGIDRESQAEPFHWVTGKSPCQTYQGRIDMTVSPSPFANEALLTFNFNWDMDGQVFPYSEVSFQVIGVNVSLSTSKTNHFPPCPKSQDDAFDTKDGPVFSLGHDMKFKVNNCRLTCLQALDQPAKIRVILYTHGRVIPCPGVNTVKLPILVNFPRLKLNNRAYKSMME